MHCWSHRRRIEPDGPCVELGDNQPEDLLRIDLLADIQSTHELNHRDVLESEITQRLSYAEQGSSPGTSDRITIRERICSRNAAQALPTPSLVSWMPLPVGTTMISSREKRLRIDSSTSMHDRKVLLILISTIPTSQALARRRVILV